MNTFGLTLQLLIKLKLYDLTLACTITKIPTFYIKHLSCYCWETRDCEVFFQLIFLYYTYNIYSSILLVRIMYTLVHILCIYV